MLVFPGGGKCLLPSSLLDVWVFSSPSSLVTGLALVTPYIQALLFVSSAWSSVQGGPGHKRKPTPTGLGEDAKYSACHKCQHPSYPLDPGVERSQTFAWCFQFAVPPFTSHHTHRQAGTAGLAVRPLGPTHLPSPVLGVGWGGGAVTADGRASRQIPETRPAVGVSRGKAVV